MFVLADDLPVVGESGPYAELLVDDETESWVGVCAACRWRADQEKARRLDLDGAHNSAAIHVDHQCPTREES